MQDKMPNTTNWFIFSYARLQIPNIDLLLITFIYVASPFRDCIRNTFYLAKTIDLLKSASIVIGFDLLEKKCSYKHWKIIKNILIYHFYNI